MQTWTWEDDGVPVVKLTKNVYRSHNTMAEECPLLWNFVTATTARRRSASPATGDASPGPDLPGMIQ
ncbi:hypothetical protein Ade02nite_34420 [Paractinoplanes deccanensis]|uniref:Uncharacterized protein n=1 Tax=Paractinoplanes deccanensis TaxID=113561 RepID=A0ABQ3Y477_9ACTN|nr:hypothetical protein Ade02nite_34420 [Actinoplanes deccanensis]